MASSPVRLLLIDHDPIFRMGLRMALEPDDDLEIVSDVTTGEEALQVLISQTDEGTNPQQTKPVDLILL